MKRVSNPVRHPIRTGECVGTTDSRRCRRAGVPGVLTHRAVGRAREEPAVGEWQLTRVGRGGEGRLGDGLFGFPLAGDQVLDLLRH